MKTSMKHIKNAFLAFAGGLAVAGCQPMTGIASPGNAANVAQSIPLAIRGGWEIETLNSESLPPQRMRFMIGPAGSVSGNVFCNRFDGVLVGVYPRLGFDNVVSTTSLCEDGRLSQRLAELFRQPAVFSVEGNRLTVRTPQGIWRFRRLLP